MVSLAETRDSDVLRGGAVVAERFRLIRELGRGGMGAVWLARHTALDVPCAVKFILEHRADSEESRARFEYEARAAAQLRSPHVVQVLDYGVWQGIPYIAMERLEGETLTELLDREGRLTLEETCEVVIGVSRALERAAARGIVHRDLKPDNIFLVQDGDRRFVKVLDFGVAKSLFGDEGMRVQTVTGAILGTPYYLSPEQAHGSKEVDHRSDLWALGVIAFECVTGELPFYREGLGDLLSTIMHGPIPNPSDQLAFLPPELDGWWRRAAARDPEERFQSAGELADALVAIGEESTVVVAPTLAQAPRMKTLEGQEVAEPSAPQAPRSALVAVAAVSIAAVVYAGFSDLPENALRVVPTVRTATHAAALGAAPARQPEPIVSVATAQPVVIPVLPRPRPRVPPPKPSVSTPSKLEPGY